MKNLKYVALLFLGSLAWGDTGFRDMIQVTETDGSPKCMAGQLKFGSGQVACSGNTATLNITGGGGGASSLAVTVGVARSSPTSDVMFNSSQFSGSVSASTMSISLNSSSVTLQGNTFNGVNQLVKTDGSGKLPAIDGSQLTNLPASGGGDNLGNHIATMTLTTNYGIKGSTVNMTAFNVTDTSATFHGTGGVLIRNALGSNVSEGHLNIWNTNQGAGYWYTGMNMWNGAAYSAPYFFGLQTGFTPIGYRWMYNGTNWMSLNGALSASQFVKTDADLSLSSFDLYASSQSFSGRNVFTSSEAIVLPNLASKSCLGTAASGALQEGTCGGGGGSSLAVFDGNVNVSSPTAIIKAQEDQFVISLAGSATAEFTLNSSSVTLLGAIIDAGELPFDGYALTYVNQSGDNMTGQLTTSSSITVRGADGLAVTYGVSAGSLTVSGTGNLTFTNPSSAQSYQIVGSSTDATVGQCARFSSSWTITGITCGTGSGGDGFYSLEPATVTITAPAIIVSTLTVTSSATFTGSINVSSGLLISGSYGTSGQLLKSNGPGGVPSWVTASGTGDAVLAATQTWTGGNALYGSTTFYGEVQLVNKSTMSLVDVLLEVSTISLVRQIRWADGTIQTSSPTAGGGVADNLGNGTGSYGVATTTGGFSSWVSISSNAIAPGATFYHSAPSQATDLIINTSLKIPTGTGPTVDAEGEFAFDTTDDVLIGYDGTAARVYADALMCETKVIGSSGTWDNQAIPIWQNHPNGAVTIASVHAAVLGGTSLTYNIEERLVTALASAGTDIYSSDQAADTNGEDESSFSNAGIAAGAHLVFTTGTSAASGAVDYITMRICYRRDVE